ncbi:hypothetical protein BV20DRAFT_959781 [Pilatotrama ljubarskyi]|nr:hypothetical protein BV20DRAFT_959781 [Pilatotrama ljubarskyi]
MKYGAPGNNQSSKLYEVLISLLELFDPAEVKRRKKEALEKIQALAKAVFSDKVEEMYEIQALATAPEAQGQGYASALVTTATDMADAAGNDTWVLTTEAYRFYEPLGFVVMGECTVGESNPTWDRPPVILRAMLRYATKGNEKV